MKKLIITGCFGRMGQELVKLAPNQGFELIAGICTHGHLHSHLHSHQVGHDLNAFIHDSDVVIDFSTPDSAIEFARICAASHKAFITGTTGFTEPQAKILKELALQIPVFVSANMSVGVAKFSHILKEASKVLLDGYDVEILEMHHNQKADSPSGTAKMLGDVVAQAAGVQLDKVMAVDRNHKRDKAEIGFASIRGGGIIGEHQVIFAGQSDVITLTHKAISRSQFALGALEVAHWIGSQPAGKVYSMDDFVSHK